MPVEHGAWRRWWRAGKFVDLQATPPGPGKTYFWGSCTQPLGNVPVGVVVITERSPPEACGPGSYEMGNTNKAAAVWNVH